MLPWQWPCTKQILTSLAFMSSFLAFMELLS
jgi:hypothetical protein